MSNHPDVGLISDQVRRALLSTPEEDLTVDQLQSINIELALNDVLPGLELHEPTAMLLDVNNLFRRARNNGFSIDYGKLKTIFEQRCDLRYCAAFSAVNRSDKNAMNWTRWMTKIGYQFIGKDLFQYTGPDGKAISKGNMDVELTLHAMDLTQNFTHVIIGTCDGDFTPLVKRLQEDPGRKVSVLGLSGQNWHGMSKTLASEADYFYDLSAFQENITYYGE